MKIAVFDTHRFEKDVFEKENLKYGFDIEFLDMRLTEKTAKIAKGANVACSFVNDRIDADCVGVLNEVGIKMIALRSAGFNHVDLEAVKKHNILVSRVPGYSPYAVAESTVAFASCLSDSRGKNRGLPQVSVRDS